MAPVFLEALFLIPAAVESYDTHAHTRTLTNTRKSTVRGCQKGKNLKLSCCTVAAWPLTAAAVLQKQQQRAERGKK